MIKRRFYKLEHGDRDAPSESSSSSDSESAAEAEATDSSDEEDSNAEVIKKDEPGLSSSGYETEDSSAHEVNLDSSGLPSSDDDVGPQRQSLGEDHLLGHGNIDLVDRQLSTVAENEEEDRPDIADCVVKRKSVFKCKLCPRIVCLSEETINAHIKSKRHARSEKLLKDGRLKLVLDTDGKLEEETPPTVALAQNSGKSQKKRRGWRGQKTRKKRREQPSSADTRHSMNDHTKKRRKRDN